MILDLLAAGKRVGVTANSHKVISNLLHVVCEAADGPPVEVRGIQGARVDRLEELPRLRRREDRRRAFGDDVLRYPAPRPRGSPGGPG